MDDRARALAVAHDRATAFLERLPERPVWPRASYDDMLEALGGDLPSEGTDPAELVEQLAVQAEPGLAGIPGGRFYGFVIGGGLPAALAADWLASTWDQNAGLSAISPAASAVETIAGGWLVDLLGLPAQSAVGFVTGATMANFTGLAVARREVLAKAGWDLDQQGLPGAPPTRIVVGEHRHSTVDRAAKFLGFGRNQLIVVPADGEGRMLPDELARALEDAGDGPLVVCLQAGEVHTGAFDLFEPLIGLAHDHGAWVHVDGAFGLWAATAESTRHLTEGVQSADSWATDGHKTLNVPYDSGMAIVRDGAAMRAVFGSRADYLIEGAGDPSERTPELSRRARGFAVWAALRSLGRDGVAALVRRLCDNAARMAAGLADIPGVEVLNDVVFTQVVATFGSDDETRALGQRLLADGTAVLTPGEWRGRVVQRCSISNWSTTYDDVDMTLAAVRRLLAE
ncbi:MAG: pyridoxal-dependent decarboxylase [Nocardioidaceae bacterium]